MVRAARYPCGRVYTPPALAEQVVRRALDPLAGGAGLRVCDPACGDGAFLVAVRKGGGPGAAHLVGADTDAAALAAARARLGDGVGLIEADALLHDWDFGTWDAVVGNPPWVSWSGRHAQALPATLRRAYAARYATFAGWPSLHGLFVELALRLVRPGGRVGMLLPAQVCDLAGYGGLRAFVRRHARVEAAWDLGEEAFAGVTQPCCALFLDAGAGGDPSEAPIPLAGPAGGDAAIAGALAHLPKPPPGMFADIGVHTGNMGRLVQGATPPPGSGLPIREGRDVGPFELGPPRKWLRTDLGPGPGEYSRVLPPERYRAVPILLRQTAARPIAALHTEPACFRNSVLACHGLAGVPPARIVAWLNSGAVGAWHRAKVREASQRSFPQVKIRHLRDLPAPDWHAPPPGLDALAREVAERGRLDRAPDLDALVSRWLGLDARRHGALDGGRRRLLRRDRPR